MGFWVAESTRTSYRVGQEYRREDKLVSLQLLVQYKRAKHKLYKVNMAILNFYRGVYVTDNFS